MDGGARHQHPFRAPGEPATLADIARICGVAVSTVSRALSRPERVSTATRGRIEKAARELGYATNTQARSLTSGRTGTIAVFVSDITNPFYFGIIRGTQQQLRASGYRQLLVDTEESDDIEDGMVHELRRSFDGAILSASRLSDRRLIELSAAFPLVAMNRQTRGVSNVFIDTPGGISHVVEHLVSLGHEHIAYASGPDSSWPNEGRWRALTVAAHGHGIRASRIGPFSPKRRSGAAAGDAVLNTGATACVAFNDLLAIGILERLAERGVSVPEDVSVVGCDDIFGADFCNPPLTTLAAPIEQAGRLAVTMLLARLDAPVGAPGPAIRQAQVLPTHLTVRRSTGPAPRNPPPLKSTRPTMAGEPESS